MQIGEVVALFSVALGAAAGRSAAAHRSGLPVVQAAALPSDAAFDTADHAATATRAFHEAVAAASAAGVTTDAVATLPQITVRLRGLPPPLASAAAAGSQAPVTTLQVKRRRT